jgi:hypothetical protein
MRGNTERIHTCPRCGVRRVPSDHLYHDGLVTCRTCGMREAAKTGGWGWIVHDIPSTEALALYEWLKPFAARDPKFTLLAAAELRRIVKGRAGWIGRWGAVYTDSELVARRARGKEVADWLREWEKPEIRKISPPGELELDGLLAVSKAAPKFAGQSAFVTYGVGIVNKAMLKQALRYRKKGMTWAPDPAKPVASAAAIEKVLKFMRGETKYTYASDGNLTPQVRSLNARERLDIAQAVKDANICARTARETELMNMEEVDKPAPGEERLSRSDDEVEPLGDALGFAWADAIEAAIPELQDPDAQRVLDPEVVDPEDREAKDPGRTDERAQERVTLWEACLGVDWGRGKAQAGALSRYAQHVTLSPGRRCKREAINAPGTPNDAVRRAAKRARDKMKRARGKTNAEEAPLLAPEPRRLSQIDAMMAIPRPENPGKPLRAAAIPIVFRLGERTYLGEQRRWDSVGLPARFQPIGDSVGNIPAPVPRLEWWRRDRFGATLFLTKAKVKGWNPSEYRERTNPEGARLFRRLIAPLERMRLPLWMRADGESMSAGYCQVCGTRVVLLPAWSEAWSRIGVCGDCHPGPGWVAGDCIEQLRDVLPV